VVIGIVAAAIRTNAAPVRLGHDDEPLARTVRVGDRKRGDAPGADARFGLGDGEFDIAGVQIAAIEDDQVLQAPADDQLALVHETQVARAQVVGVVAGGAGPEGLLADFRLAPVGVGVARSMQPDFANLAGWTMAQRAGVDDGDAVLRLRIAATDEFGGAGAVLRRHGAPVLQCALVKAQRQRQFGRRQRAHA
jgi:hypothetical protein